MKIIINNKYKSLNEYIYELEIEISGVDEE